MEIIYIINQAAVVAAARRCEGTAAQPVPILAPTLVAPERVVPRVRRSVYWLAVRRTEKLQGSGRQCAPSARAGREVVATRGGAAHSGWREHHWGECGVVSASPEASAKQRVV